MTVDLHRLKRRDSITGIATCQPDVGRAEGWVPDVSIDREIAPRCNERRTHPPRGRGPSGQKGSTWSEGFGGIPPPPMTHIAGEQGAIGPANLSARVSAVALGMLGMVVIESATGSY